MLGGGVVFGGVVVGVTTMIGDGCVIGCLVVMYVSSVLPMLRVLCVCVCVFRCGCVCVVGGVLCDVRVVGVPVSHANRS